MGITGAIVLLVALAAVGLAIRGLFNRGRSIGGAVGGVVLVLGASLGGLHAWGEGQSIPWTMAYLIIVLIGLAAIFRQITPRKQKPETSEQAD